MAFFLLAGCSSMPKKDFSSREGVIAAFFGVPETDVKQLMGQKGITENSAIKILYISQSTYMKNDEVMAKLNGGEKIDEIAEKAGLKVSVMEEKTKELEESIKSRE